MKIFNPFRTIKQRVIAVLWITFLWLLAFSVGSATEIGIDAITALDPFAATIVMCLLIWPVVWWCSRGVEK